MYNVLVHVNKYSPDSLQSRVWGSQFFRWYIFLRKQTFDKSVFLRGKWRKSTAAESKEKHGVEDPMSELTITSPYVDSRVDSNKFMYHGQSYSTVDLNLRTKDLASDFHIIDRFKLLHSRRILHIQMENYNLTESRPIHFFIWHPLLNIWEFVHFSCAILLAFSGINNVFEIDIFPIPQLISHYCQFTHILHWYNTPQSSVWWSYDCVSINSLWCEEGRDHKEIGGRDQGKCRHTIINPILHMWIRDSCVVGLGAVWWASHISNSALLSVSCELVLNLALAPSWE